jgi:RimJ/RimL family protein N-acetyltransferase
VIDKFFVEKGNKKIQITLRYPRISDTRQMMYLINSLIEENARIHMNKKLNIKQEKEYVGNMMNDVKKKKKICVVAETGKRIIGTTEISAGLGTVSHLGTFGILIVKDYRGIGIGYKMMTTILDMSENIGVNIVKLSVAADNKNAQKLYKSMGFKKMGTIPKAMKFGNKYIDEVYMYKVL